MRYRTNPTIARSTLPKNARRRNVRRPAPTSTLAGAFGRFAMCVALGAVLGAMLAFGA